MSAKLVIALLIVVVTEGGLIVFPFINQYSSNTFPSGCSNNAEEAMQAHNELRSNHGVPPLVLNDQLCAEAQKWVQYLADQDTGLKHSPRSGQLYGENVYWSSMDATPRHVVEKFYKEIKNYNYDNPEFSVGETGHFTQLVWKATTMMGFAMAKTRTGGCYAVAIYVPGQLDRPQQLRLNVPRPLNGNWQKLLKKQDSPTSIRWGAWKVYEYVPTGYQTFTGNLNNDWSNTDYSSPNIWDDFIKPQHFTNYPINNVNADWDNDWFNNNYPSYGQGMEWEELFTDLFQ